MLFTAGNSRLYPHNVELTTSSLAWHASRTAILFVPSPATTSILKYLRPSSTCTDCLPRCPSRDGTSPWFLLDMARQKGVEEGYRRPQPHSQGTSLTALGLAPSITDLELVARILCVCETRLTRRSLSTRRRKFTGRQSCNLSVGTHIQQDRPMAASIHVEVGTHPSPQSACILPSCVHVQRRAGNDSRRSKRGSSNVYAGLRR